MLPNCLQEMSQHAALLQHRNTQISTPRETHRCVYCISERMLKSVDFRDILNLVRDEGLFKQYTWKIIHNCKNRIKEYGRILKM